MNKQEYFSCKLVKPEDLNPAGTLFGGRVLEWLDEVAALYAMKKLICNRIVTKKITEVDFLCPGGLGDYLEFFCAVKDVGTTSITITTEVFRKSIQNMTTKLLVTCTFVFVAVDGAGRSTPHGGITLDHVH